MRKKGAKRKKVMRGLLISFLVLAVIIELAFYFGFINSEHKKITDFEWKKISEVQNNSKISKINKLAEGVRNIFSNRKERIMLAPGNTYYVDSISGNDANSGTSTTSAWKTITKLNSFTFSAGDSILFKRGQTWNGQFSLTESGALGSPITIGAYGTGNMPFIDASTISGSGLYGAILLNNANYITIDGLKLGASWDGNRGSAIQLLRCTNITIKNNELIGTFDQSVRGVWAYSSSDYQVINNTIHGFNYGTYWDQNDPDTTLFPNILIENNTIYDITKGTFSDWDGIKFNTPVPRDFPGLIISGNNVFNYAEDGIDIYRVQGAIIEANYIHDAIAFGEADNLDGIKTNVAGNIFRYNRIENIVGTNHTYGILADNNDNQVYYNTIRNISTTHPRGVIDKDVAGIRVSGTNCKVYNNVVKDVKEYGILVYSGTADVKNNIVEKDGGVSDIKIESGASVSGGYNILVNDSAVSGGTYTGAANDKYRVNPLFVDAVNGNFHLQSNSPAKDSGTTISGIPERDFEGNIIQGNPDIGAYEYLEVSSPIFYCSFDSDYSCSGISPSRQEGSLSFINNKLFVSNSGVYPILGYNPESILQTNQGTIEFKITPKNWNKNNNQKALFFSNSGEGVIDLRYVGSGGSSAPSYQLKLSVGSWNGVDCPNQNCISTVYADIEDWFNQDGSLKNQNQEHLITLTWDDAKNEVVIYVDNELRGIKRDNFDFFNPYLSLFYIGTPNTDWRTAYGIPAVNAEFDDFKIYDYVRNPDGFTGNISLFYQNPMSHINPENRFADPTISKYNGVYYLWGTSSHYGYKMWKSSDLIHWQLAGKARDNHALHIQDDFGNEAKHFCNPDITPDCNNYFWGGNIIQYNEKFYMIYSAKMPNSYGDIKNQPGVPYYPLKTCIAVSDDPEGPYQTIKCPLSLPETTPWIEDIDGDIFIDDNGKIYWFADGGMSDGQACVESPLCNENEKVSRIYVWEMTLGPTSSDISLIGSPSLVVEPDQQWEYVGSQTMWSWNEGPDVIKKDGIYYIMYTGNVFTSPNYAASYATAINIMGPWTKPPAAGNPLFKKNPAKGISGPGQGDFILGLNDKDILYFYRTMMDSTNFNKGLYINFDKLSVHDGIIEPLNAPSWKPQELSPGENCTNSVDDDGDDLIDCADSDCNVNPACIPSICSDHICSVGENCARDNSSCTDNVCYLPTCTNGCGQVAVTNGLNDIGCSGANQYCNGAGSCITAICSVGEKRCTVNILQVCNASRTGWDNSQDCNTQDRNYCSTTKVMREDYVCTSGSGTSSCASSSSIVQECNDTLYCNGQESCNPASVSCVLGTAISCSSNNLVGISTCNNNPDNIIKTFDFFAGFTSSCNELSDSCSTGIITLTHSCDKTRCSAQCEINNDCSCSSDVCQDRDSDGKLDDYVDYPINGICNSSCGCNINSCNPTITLNDGVHCGQCTTNAQCRDSIACNGQETCVGGFCQIGADIDCSSNNINPFSRCDNIPDSNIFTLDSYSGFISSCVEPSGTCTPSGNWQVQITHVCKKTNCNAQCESNIDCNDSNYRTQDNCLSNCSCEHILIDDDGDNVNNSNDYCPNTPSTISKDRITSYGCILPLYEKFKVGISSEYNITSNLSNLRNLSGVANLTLGIPGKGMIIFENQNMNIEGVDLDSNINFSQGFIFINSNNLTMLNKNAKIQFFNISFITPRVLRDGVVCSSPECTEISYSSGIYVISVSGFSTYTLTENYVPPPVVPPDNPGGGGGGNGCNVNWNCSSWSFCTNGEKSRTCTDRNNCGSSIGKPNETAVCSCIEDWVCDEWKACANETQTRTCTDANNCMNSLPSLEKKCDISGEKLVEKIKQSNTIFYFTIVFSVAVVLVIIVILFFLFFNKIKSSRKWKNKNAVKEIRKRFEEQEKAEDELSKAKFFIQKARAKGYRDDQIRRMFVDKGWSRKQIEKLGL